MFDHEDLKWIAGTSTSLNSMLHQIAKYTDLARRHPENPNYVNLVGERVDLATRTAQALFDRVTSNILETTAARAANRKKGPTAPFTVLPPPVPIKPQTAANADLTKLTTTPQPPVTRENAPASAPAPGTDELNVRNINGPRELILFIEDEQEVAEIAAQMLVDEGYKVILASDGFEALRIYGKIGKQIGLVILDFFLPVMDGDAVFDELRSMNPDIAVVLSSGFAEQQKVSSMLTQGLRGFIPKPYTREKLLSQVRSILDSGRQAGG